jgi:zinc protease
VAVEAWVARRDYPGDVSAGPEVQMFLTALLFSASNVAFAQMPPAPDFNIEVPAYNVDTRAYTFPSGLRVLLQVDDAAPVVSVVTVIDGGASDDPSGKSGTAQLAEYLWFQSRPAGVRVQDELYALGTLHHASTNADHTAFLTVGPKESLPALLGLESQRLTGGLVGVQPPSFAAARELVKQRPLLQGDDIFLQAVPHLYERAFAADHPYGGIRAPGEGLEGIQLAEVVAWANENWTVDRTTLMIAGDIDMDEATTLLFAAMEPTLFHPDVTEEHVKKYAKPSVEDHDPANPAHWTIVLSDPANPKAMLPMDVDLPPRASEESPPAAKGPAVGEPPKKVMALVEEPTLVVAWPIPGSYRQNGHLFAVVGGTLNGLVRDKLGQDLGVATDPVLGTPKIDCTTQQNVDGSVLMCAIGLTPQASAESMADRVMDQVALLWHPDFGLLLDQLLYSGQRRGLTRVLHSIDDLAAPDSGRAAATARYAHFTGRLTLHSDMINAVLGTSAAEVKQFALDNLDRKQAVTLLLEPLPGEARLAGLGRAVGYPGDLPNPSFRLSGDSITRDDIVAAYSGPDLSDLSDKTLSNGVRVVVKPHGVAPTVNGLWVWGGGRSTGDLGVDDYADAFARRMPNPMLWDPKASVIDVAGSWEHTRDAEVSVERLKGSAGNLDSIAFSLRRIVQTREAGSDGKARWLKVQKNALIADLFSRDRWSDTLQWAHLAPDHPLPWRAGWSDLERWKSMGPSDVSAYNNTKYTTDNGTLVFVGNVKPSEATQHAERYLKSWKASGAPIAGIGAPAAPPTSGKVVLLDEAGGRFATIDLGCRMAEWQPDTWAASALLGQLLDEALDDGLGKDGVPAYAAAASAQQYPGGLGMLQLFTLTEAGKAGAAIQRLQAVAALPASGGLDEGRLAVHKLHYAREYGLRFQSAAGMQAGIVDILKDPRRDFAWYDTLGEQIADVDGAALTTAAGSCADHAIITVRGPVAQIGPSLEAAGVAFEVFDWKAEANADLLLNDPKAAKKRAKAAGK